MAFEGLSDRLQNAMGSVTKKGKITEADLKQMMREVRLALLEADVNFKVVKDFVRKVNERALGSNVLEALSPAQQVVKIVNEELTELMGGEQAPFQFSPKPPTVVMMVGLQGAGKTTTAGKLASFLAKHENKRPLLVAADVYRPAAIDQLQTLGKQLNYPVKTKKIKQKDLYFAAFALENSLGEYYLEKRPSKGLLADMWTFPLTELPAADFEKMVTDGSVSKNIIIPELPESISKMEYIANFTHIFSHQKWHLAIIKLKPEETFEGADELLSEDKMWVHFDSKVLTENGQPKVSRSQIPLAGPQVKMFEILDKKNKKIDLLK